MNKSKQKIKYVVISIFITLLIIGISFLIVNVVKKDTTNSDQNTNSEITTSSVTIDTIISTTETSNVTTTVNSTVTNITDITTSDETTVELTTEVPNVTTIEEKKNDDFVGPVTNPPEEKKESSEDTTVASTEKPTTETSETTTVAESTTVIETSNTEETKEEVNKKSDEEIADEVINGHWGNGSDRKNRLTEAGYNYDEIQKIVTEKIKSSRSVTSSMNYSVGDLSNMSYVKRFSRGTYYAYGYSVSGGSTRSLIDCSWGDGVVKGSIASSYLYSNYDYNYNGKRTMVYLEVYDKYGVKDYSGMNGYYYVDDCDAWNPNVIDFYYTYESSCPFQNDGVVDVECWIVNY